MANGTGHGIGDFGRATIRDQTVRTDASAERPKTERRRSASTPQAADSRIAMACPRANGDELWCGWSELPCADATVGSESAPPGTE